MPTAISAEFLRLIDIKIDTLILNCARFTYFGYIPIQNVVVINSHLKGSNYNSMVQGLTIVIYLIWSCNSKIKYGQTSVQK